jgi:hypothetical protein
MFLLALRLAILRWILYRLRQILCRSRLVTFFFQSMYIFHAPARETYARCQNQYYKQHFA